MRLKFSEEVMNTIQSEFLDGASTEVLEEILKQLLEWNANSIGMDELKKDLSIYLIIRSFSHSAEGIEEVEKKIIGYLEKISSGKSKFYVEHNFGTQLEFLCPHDNKFILLSNLVKFQSPSNMSIISHFLGSYYKRKSKKETFAKNIGANFSDNCLVELIGKIDDLLTLKKVLKTALQAMPTDLDPNFLKKELAIIVNAYKKNPLSENYFPDELLHVVVDENLKGMLQDILMVEVD